MAIFYKLIQDNRRNAANPGSWYARAAHPVKITTSQLAAQTRILVQTIEDMEQNKFKRIPAPIYGRGFVKLIYESLDLDPVTMVPAFMSAYNGEPQIDDEPVPAGGGGIRYAQPLNRPRRSPRQAQLRNKGLCLTLLLPNLPRPLLQPRRQPPNQNPRKHRFSQRQRTHPFPNRQRPPWTVRYRALNSSIRPSR